MTRRFIQKRQLKPGTPSGALIARPDASLPSRWQRIDIRPEKATVADEAASLLGPRNEGGIIWIHCQGHPDPAQLRELGEHYGLHTLALEDVLNQGQRPKAEAYDDFWFVVINRPSWHADGILMEQVSLFLGDGFLFSFYSGSDDPFAPIRTQLLGKGNRLRTRGADHLLYALIDLIVDHSFALLESVDETLESLEDEVLDEQVARDLPLRLHDLKRRLLTLRRQFWPVRELLAQLVKDEGGLIRDETRLFLRDVQDHVHQIMELIEGFREMANGLLEIYLSSATHRLNESMRFLTIIATLFIPLTFIVGVYGMNFAGASDSPWAMPELR